MYGDLVPWLLLGVGFSILNNTRCCPPPPPPPPPPPTCRKRRCRRP